MSDPFKSTPAETPEPSSYFEALVGEGKKFGDPEELAKGKWKSDQHITGLERQLAEMREDLAKASKIEELMELVRSQRASSPTGGNVDNSSSGPSQPNRTDAVKVSEEDIKALVSSQLSEHEKASRRQKNLEEVNKALTKSFGEATPKVVKETAEALGMTVEEMGEMAAEKPAAFLRLIGNTSRNDVPATIGTSVRSEANANRNSDTRNFAWYQAQRKALGSKYYAPAFQMQMMKDAERMGPDFYS